MFEIKLMGSKAEEDFFCNLPCEELQVVLPSTSPVSDLKSKVQLNSVEETLNGVSKHRVEATRVDSWGLFSRSEGQEYDKRNLRTCHENDLCNDVEAEISHNISGSTGDLFARDPPSNRTAEGYGCSNYEPQEITRQSQFGSDCDQNGLQFKGKEPPDFIEERDSDQNSLCPSKSSGQGSIPQVRYRNINFGGFPVNSSLVSSDGTCTEVPPASFQFYVSSQEGINLFVDLSSSSLDWMNSLKNEVCVHQKVQNSNSSVLHELRSGEQIKVSFLGDRGVKIQTEGDSICNESFLSSIERVGGHLVVDLPDGTDIKLRSSSRFPSSTAVETVQDHERVSSLCELQSDLQNPTDLCSESCLRNCETVILGSEVPNISQTKTGTYVADSKSCVSKLVASSDHQSKNGIPPENAEAVPILISCGSCKRDPLPPNSAILESCGGVCPRCSSSDSISMAMQLSEVASHREDKLNSRCQKSHNHDSRDLDYLMNNLQAEIGGSPDCELDQNTCRDPPYSYLDEWGTITVNESERSECLQVNCLLEKTCKRPNSLDPEGLQSKRQHKNVDGNNHHGKPDKPDMENLRGKNLEGEVLPRRSMRLVFK